MPRTISGALAATFAEEAFHVAILARIQRTDGVIIACTGWDEPLTYAGDIFEPTEGLKVSTLSTALGTGADNQDFSGFITDSRITLADIRARRYRNADFHLMLLDPTDIAAGHVDLFRGKLGEITQQGEIAISAEVAGLVAQLQTTIGQQVTHRCTCHELGNAICGVDVTGSFGGHSGQVSVNVVAAGASLTFASTAPAGFFAFGTAKALNGANSGLKRDIKTHTVAGPNATVALNEGFPFAFAPGDTVRVTVGCDRLFSTCRDKFANANRFPAFPHLLGQQKFLQVGR